MKTITHSKIKNTGILFELLARQVTADTIEGKASSPALDLLRKYYNPKTELGKEWSLYKAFFNINNLSEARAINFVDMILNQRKRLNNRKLLEQKYNLVKDIKEKYPLKEFLACKIPAYKVYASIYKTFLAESTHDPVLDLNDLAQSRFTIIEHVMGSQNISKQRENSLVENFEKQSEDVRLLTYRLLVDKFNQKYSNLSEKQKYLLREYINNISNTNSLKDYIKSEIPLIKSELKRHAAVIDSKITQIKLKEVAAQLDTIGNSAVVKDEHVTALMIAYQIVNQLKAL